MATEFFLYTAVFMFIVIIAFFVVNRVQSSEIPQRENAIARDTGEFFASAIVLAVKAGSGFTYNYTFPRTVLGNPYNMSFSSDNGAMILDWEGRYGVFSQSYPLPSYNYKFGGCITNPGASGVVHVFTSSACSNVLTLANDGENLTIYHGG